MDLKELKERFEQHGVNKVKVGGFDLDGVLRGKYVSLDKLWSAVESGFGFCDVIFGWDCADVLYDNAKLTGWHTGYPDAHATLDLDTFRVIPWEPRTAAFLVDFVDEEGRPHPACGRGLLKKILERARAMGFRATFAAEYEFFLFRETPRSLHQKGFRDLEPLSPGMFGYSWVREGQNSALCHAIMDEMSAFDIPIEGLHTETGPGVYEVAIRYDDALRMADKAALFKPAMKQLAARFEVTPTFMAKWNAALPGSSGHLHQSLWSNAPPSGAERSAPPSGAERSALLDASKNLFHDPKDRLSALARSYIAGQLAHMPAFTAIYSPTINSYKRYVPGVWAPLTATWGIENRTCAIRAIPGDAKSTRVEYRQTAADMNPYLAIAAALAAGLDGVEKKLALGPEARGDASRDERAASLPRTLREATQKLRAHEDAARLLGADFVDHWARTRDWECRQYERAVTSWELERYFEII